MISELLEALMIISFGLSWPMNITKAWKARTTKGTSLPFMLLVDFGYAAGITSKITMMISHTFSGNWTAILGFAFYIANFLMVTTGICIYFRNNSLDRIRL